MTTTSTEAIRFGKAALRFQLEWTGSSSSTAADATRGRLAVWVGEQLVWGGLEAGEAVGFEWTWVELLEHLANAWPYLEYEQADPVGLDEPPPLLRTAAEQRWAELPSQERSRKEEQLLGFLDTHDLSRGLHGAWPEPLWLLREGDEMRLWCGDAYVRASKQGVLGAVEELGDAIHARLGPLADARAEAVRKQWRCRGETTAATFIEVATGLDSETIELVAQRAGLGTRWELESNDGWEENEFLAVARMAWTSVGPDDLVEVLGAIRTLPHVWTQQIDDLSEEVRREIAALDSARPYEQGYAVATWLRRKRQVPTDETFDVDALLSDWKVEVREIKLNARTIDAISCWGRGPGPGIILNRRGIHTRFGARRATLAHEIAHLLLDRQGALPVAEVLGGRVSEEIEARARAFAAELLLPAEAAAREVARTSEIKSVVSNLVERFRVSQALTAWQVRNSGARITANERAYLRSLVSAPSLF